LMGQDICKENEDDVVLTPFFSGYIGHLA
jgi:hypothetical protein